VLTDRSGWPPAVSSGQRGMQTAEQRAVESKAGSSSSSSRSCMREQSGHQSRGDMLLPPRLLL